MTDDKLGFLDGKEPDEEIETEAEEVAAEAEAEPEPEEKTEPEPEGEEEEAAPPAAAQEHHQQPVPITALLDEREKRQAADRRAQEAEQRLRAIEEQIRRQQAQKPAPDWFEDPNAAFQHQAQAMQDAAINDRLNMSQFLAAKDFGEEIVAEAEAFFRQNPQHVGQFQRHPSPWHAAVEFYKRQKFLRDVGDDPDAYINAQVEARLQERLANPVSAKPKAPPPSMAKAPSTGRDSITPGNTFDRMFK